MIIYQRSAGAKFPFGTGVSYFSSSWEEEYP